jgi:hypothetical protein
MTSFWSRYFPERSVASIAQPTWVRIDARVASANAHASPFSSASCAAARYWLLDARREEIASGWIGDELVLASDEGPTIAVPLSPSTLTNSVDAITPAPLPEQARELAREARYYREVCVAHGARVELRAVVEPMPETGYRQSAARLRASPEHPISLFVYPRTAG